MRRHREPLLTGPSRRVTPEDLGVPPPPPVPSGAVLGHPVGWSCPSCHRVYAPWVACCGTCGPQDADGRTEISEGPGVS